MTAIILVEMTEKQKFALETYQDADQRREEALCVAQSQNDVYHKTILETDPDEGSTDERIAAQEKIFNCERDTELAWERYKKAHTRFLYASEAARKLGVLR